MFTAFSFIYSLSSTNELIETERRDTHIQTHTQTEDTLDRDEEYITFIFVTKIKKKNYIM